MTAEAPRLHGGCHQGMPVRRDNEPGSGCRRACLHRALVAGYHDARDAREALRESAATAPAGVAGTAGADVAYYQLSDDEFAAHVPPVLFKDWLVAHKRPHHDEEVGHGREDEDQGAA